jgi:hypothetical protein
LAIFSISKVRLEIDARSQGRNASVLFPPFVSNFAQFRAMTVVQYHARGVGLRYKRIQYLAHGAFFDVNEWTEIEG